MNWRFYLITCILLFVGCSIIKENDKDEIGEGLCIYPTEIEYSSDLSHHLIDYKTAPIIGSPIISYDDIVSYDTTKHILDLVYSRDSLKARIGMIGVLGSPFLITLDSQKNYGGWFWTPFSSIACHWVVILPDDIFGLEINEIRIKLGYPTEEHFVGEDPRNNRQIFNRLVMDSKAK